MENNINNPQYEHECHMDIKDI